MSNRMMEIWICCAEALSYCDGGTEDFHPHILKQCDTEGHLSERSHFMALSQSLQTEPDLYPRIYRDPQCSLKFQQVLKQYTMLNGQKNTVLKKKIKVMTDGINYSCGNAEAAFFPFLLLDPIQNWIDEWWPPNWQEESNKNFLLSQFSFQVKFASLRMISTSVRRHADFLL